MKVLMCNWAGTAKNLPAWFKHDKEAEVSWEQIQELYETGNNVMMKHVPSLGHILFVDDRGFGQR